MSEVRLVVAILVPAIFTLILKDFFDLFMTNRYEGKVKQYTIWMLYFLLDTAISMNFKFVGVISMLYSFIILIIFCAVLYREDIKYITLYEQYTDDKLSREDFLLKRRSTMKKQPDWRKG